MSRSRVLKNKSEYTIVTVPDEKPEKRYAIEKTSFAQGGFGQIYKAYPIVEENDAKAVVDEDQIFVAKVMHKKTVSPFEIECLQKFHEGEKPIFLDEDQVICLYKYRPGQNLGQDSELIAVGEGCYLREFSTVIHKAPLNIKIKVILEIAKKIKLLHEQGIAHGDIKLSNIRVWIEGNKIEVHLIDFGSARKVSIDPNELSSVDVSYSSTVFAPEISVDKRIGLKSDIYAFAAVILSILGASGPLVYMLYDSDNNTFKREKLSGYPLDAAMKSNALCMDGIFSNFKEHEKQQLKVCGLSLENIIYKFIYRMMFCEYSSRFKRASHKDRPNSAHVCDFFAALLELGEKNISKHKENLAKMIMLSVGAWDKRFNDIDWSCHQNIIQNIIHQSVQQDKLSKKLGISLEQCIANEMRSIIAIIEKNNEVLFKAKNGVRLVSENDMHKRESKEDPAVSGSEKNSNDPECKENVVALEVKNVDERESKKEIDKLRSKEALELKDVIQTTNLNQIKDQYERDIKEYRTKRKGLARVGAIDRIDELFKVLQSSSSFYFSDPLESVRIMIGCFIYEAKQAQVKHFSQLFVRSDESRLSTILNKIIIDQGFVNYYGEMNWKCMPFVQFEAHKETLMNNYLKYFKETDKLRRSAVASAR